MTKFLVPWDIRSPQLFYGLQRDMKRLVDDFFGEENGGTETRMVTAPRANFAETEKEYEITLDLPGISPEDVTVELREGQLWISGQRKEEVEEEGKTYHRIECRYGEFRRVVPLEMPVDADNIQAEYKNGVLRVTLPKVQAVQPKRIEIKS